MILFPHHKSRISSPYSSAEKGEERLLASAEQPPEVSLENSPCSSRKPSFFWHSLKSSLFFCFLIFCTLLPMQVLAVTPQIAAGGYHTVALKSDGTVVAWGNNLFGQTTPPAGLAGVTAIAAGRGGHTVALKSDGTVVVWGDGLYGQRTIPAGLVGVTAIAAGTYHTVALKNDGTLVAWGG